jgi:hypothetical protein
MSPRIAWYGFLKFGGRLAKLVGILAVLTGLGWSGWLGVQHAFHQNPDFRLQVIDLNANPVIDELGLVQATGIGLSTSLFTIDVDEVIRKLKARPEIADAHAERHLPGTLVVRVLARTPQAWICGPQAVLSQVRRSGAMLVDHRGIAYPCPEMQLESALKLPTIQLPASEKYPIVAGQHLGHPELAHCFRLLASACEADAEAIHWIESVKQVNEWSLLLVTRQGTAATFGLGDHERQIHNLNAAMDNANQKGYSIDTINLIPKHNIPITLHTETTAPPAQSLAEPPPGHAEISAIRRARDLSTLLNRN